MRKVEPAPAEGGQAEAADSVASVKDSANPEGGEAEEQGEEEDDAMVDAESELEAEADAGAVGSMEDSAVPEEGGAEEEAEERKGEVLLDAAAVAVGSVDDSVKPEGDSAVEEAAEEHRDDALVDDHVKTEDQGTESAETKDEIQGNEGGEMKYDTQGNEAAEMEVDKAGNGDGHTEAKVDSDNGSSPKGEGNNDGDTKKDVNGENQLVSAPAGVDGEGQNLSNKVSDNSFMFDYTLGGDDSGTEEEQAEFLKELERFHTEKLLEFKAPKFYGEGLNCLKLWRQVTGLGGYDQVTSNKLWRQVGESFKPPKTCTTVSWTFRNFYEKALIEYEKHKIETGEFHVAASTLTDRIVSDSQVGGSNAGSGRARRESATRAMQGWHSQRLLGNGEIADPVIKDKAAALSVPKKDKTPKSSGSAKRKRTPTLEDERVMPYKSEKLQNDSSVIDIGPPADWVKINVRRTKDCYEVYALVPGLLREEVHVQSDPAGRLIVTGEPEQLDNPWGVTPFKKTGQVYYINWEDGTRTTVDPRTSSSSSPFSSSPTPRSTPQASPRAASTSSSGASGYTSASSVGAGTAAAWFSGAGYGGYGYNDSDGYNDADEESSSSSSSSQSSAVSSFSPTDESASSGSGSDNGNGNNAVHVLVAAGCRACFMYFMVPKSTGVCPKCGTPALLYLGRSGSNNNNAYA